MRRILPIILLSVALAAGTWLGMRTGTRLDAGPVLKVYFLDVQQGDSSLVQTPDGKNILIDAGEDDAGPGVVDFLRMHGVKSIDLLVMTNPLSDHIGGIPNVLDSFPVKLVLDSACLSGSGTQRQILSGIEEAKIPYMAAQAGQKLRLGKDVRLNVLSPRTGFISHRGNDTDNNSVVLQLVYGKIRFLFPGDIHYEAEGDLIDSRCDLQSNVMKVAHHGSSESSSLEFLRQIRPDYVVISVGEHNRYHYPHRRTLKRLSPERLGAELYRTDNNGTVAMKTDGNIIIVESER